MNKAALLGSSKLVLISTGLCLSAVSWGQITPAAEPSVVVAQSESEAPAEDNEIVVTGTSIRGAPPVGGNLVSVGREAIENTGAVNVQQILKTVPAITGLGGAGVGQNAGNSYYAPTIHSLGASASSSTLVLIDGHRLPLGGISLALPDPSIVPPIALERVEVLAEGASATYGSDAVAGVVNFITRKRFDGVSATGQVGFGADYRTYTAGLLGGKTWDTGSALIAGGYSRSNAIPFNYNNRPYLQPDHRDEGGTNFQSFNCSPATIQPGGQALIYLSPTATSGVANTTANAPCDTQVFGDRIGQETRYNLMVKLEQQIGDKLTVSSDIIYSNRKTLTSTPRGGIQATVFRTGAQANPFYVNPPGVLPGTTAGNSQTIRWQADELLGPGAQTDNNAETWIGTFNAEYRFGDNFRLTALALIGQDRSEQVSTGQLCTSCATLALNGSTQASGSLTIPVPGTTNIVTMLPLTVANALDVWNPAATNRTSAAVRALLTDSRTAVNGKNTLKQFRVGVDGALFELPAGAVRVAVGLEAQDSQLDSVVTRPNNSGPASLGSTTRFFPLSRDVKSAYGEVLVPLISPDNDSFIYRADLNISGRYDDYSDFGTTFNPKFAANLEIVQGLKLRANWSKSFVAPSQRSVGDPTTGTYSNSTATGTTTTAQVPIASFPTITQIPGIPCSGGFCTIGGNVQGVTVDTGNPNLGPQKGRTWSVGIDLAPVALPGLRASATLFTNELRGGITAPILAGALNSSGLNYLFTVYPTGATQAQLAGAISDVPITSALPGTVYYILRRPQTNAIDLDVRGLDISANYQFDAGASTFNVGGSITEFLKFDQSLGGGATYSILNTVGINSTYPSIKRQARANIGWSMEAISAELFVNHVGKYRNWGTGTINPLVIDANGNVSGGGDRVKSFTTVDLHAAYAFSKSGVLGDSEVYVDVNNLFDKDPPFFNVAQGYDPFGSNPLGRVVSVGFRLKY